MVPYSIILLVITGLSICTSSVLSFEFIDTEFDKELQSQIDDFADESEGIGEIIRLKRGTEDGNVIHDEHIKCKQQSRKSCCGSKSNLFKHFGDHDKTLGKACYEDVMQQFKTEAANYEQNQTLFSGEKYKLLKKVQYCVFECSGKKRGLLKSDGNLDMDELNKYLTKEVFTESWQKDLSPKIVERCLKEKYPEWPENEPGVKCNPIYVQFQYCLWKEFELNCPESEQKTSKKCNKLRNLMRTQSTYRKKS